VEVLEQIPELLQGVAQESGTTQRGDSRRCSSRSPTVHLGDQRHCAGPGEPGQALLSAPVADLFHVQLERELDLLVLDLVLELVDPVQNLPLVLLGEADVDQRLPGGVGDVQVLDPGLDVDLLGQLAEDLLVDVEADLEVLQGGLGGAQSGARLPHGLGLVDPYRDLDLEPALLAGELPLGVPTEARCLRVDLDAYAPDDCGPCHGLPPGHLRAVLGEDCVPVRHRTLLLWLLDLGAGVRLHLGGLLPPAASGPGIDVEGVVEVCEKHGLLAPAAGSEQLAPILVAALEHRVGHALAWEALDQGDDQAGVVLTQVDLEKVDLVVEPEVSVQSLTGLVNVLSEGQASPGFWSLFQMLTIVWSFARSPPAHFRAASPALPLPEMFLVIGSSFS